MDSQIYVRIVEKVSPELNNKKIKKTLSDSILERILDLDNDLIRCYFCVMFIPFLFYQLSGGYSVY